MFKRFGNTPPQRLNNRYFSTCYFESGRSMVEMLGVIALVGVLSIGGIYGYTKAMERHRVNELLNEAMKRAVLVSGQMAAGGDLPTLEPDSSGHTYTVKKNGDKQFSIDISGVGGETCELMQQMTGRAIQAIECAENSATFTFNNDLSTEKSEDEEGMGTPETRAYDNNQAGCEGAGYQYCSDNKCITTSETCPDGSALCANQYPGTSEYNRGGYAGTIDEKACRCPSEKVYSETDGCVAGCSSLGILGEDGTCTCKNGGDYPFCKKQCKCSAVGDGDNACACADSLDQIFCSNKACIVHPVGQECRCADWYPKNCACADSLDDIVCGDYACITRPAGKQCKCAPAGSCACADSLDDIICTNYSCIAKPAGKQCKCGDTACACADSLDDIVCGYEVCIAKPAGKQCKCSGGDTDNACACADSLDDIVCGTRACIVKQAGQECACYTGSAYTRSACLCTDPPDSVSCTKNFCFIVPAGKVCWCAPNATTMDGCACANSYYDLQCNDDVCVSTCPEGTRRYSNICIDYNAKPNDSSIYGRNFFRTGGQVCTCGANVCYCADSEDQIVCGEKSIDKCIIKPEGQECKCSTSGTGDNACACADSLDDIVCNDYICTVIPVSMD